MSSSISKRFSSPTFAFAMAGAAVAQDAQLFAAVSDPRVMGWMQGTPVREDKRITVRSKSERCPEFHYITVNTDVLGWTVTRVTGMSCEERLSKILWSKIGAASSASTTADAVSTPVRVAGFRRPCAILAGSG